MTAGIGVVGVLMASAFWGSNFAVTKGYDMKDGMVFQFWMATGILVVGLVTLVFANKDPISTKDFRPVLAYDGVLGGAIWCLGNLLTVSIVNSIGLGLGLSIWGGVSLVVSFIIGLIGVLGLEPQVINEALGIPGVVLAVASLVLFSFVQPTVKAAGSAKKEDEGDSDEAAFHLMNDVGGEGYDANAKAAEEEDEKAASGTFTRVKGLAMAVTSGLVYGIQFVPLTLWLQANTPGNSTNVTGWVPDGCQAAMTDPTILGNITQCAVFPTLLATSTSSLDLALQFIFSQFVGIFAMSLVALIVYVIATCNKPQELPTRAFGPSLLSGVVWGLGGMGSIFATDGLGLSVGYPLTLNGAFLVNTCLSFFVYREIQGKRNIIFFLAAGVLNIVSVVLLALAKS